MNRKHNRNFLDILTEEEKVYYTNYKSGGLVTSYDVTMQNSICRKQKRYNKEKEWAERMAYDIAIDFGVSAGLVSDVLYSAMVWGETIK